jgi:hypothetical protein
MRGVSGLGTCTHLNDLLRSLGDVSTLIARNGEPEADEHRDREHRDGAHGVGER